jgi:hypothetical protein
MADKPQNDSRRRVPADVQAHQRDKFVREHNENERAKSAAKTAKLRALRLAKEAADMQAQQKPEAGKAGSQTDAESPRRKRVFRF